MHYHTHTLDEHKHDYMHASTLACLCVCMHARAHACTCTRMDAQTRAHMYARLHACSRRRRCLTLRGTTATRSGQYLKIHNTRYACTRINANVHTRTRTHACTHVCEHVCAHVNTHALHTCTRARTCQLAKTKAELESAHHEATTMATAATAVAEVRAAGWRCRQGQQAAQAQVQGQQAAQAQYAGR